jgi:hypothetical protein
LASEGHTSQEAGEKMVKDHACWRRTTRRIATLAATLSASGALGLGGAGVALAADATLSIYTAGLNTCQDPQTGRVLDYLVEVRGQVSNYYGSGFRVSVDLWDDDQWDDDHLKGPVYLTYRQPFTVYDMLCCVDRDTLDEDWGEDEVFAKVLIQDLETGRNASLRPAEWWNDTSERAAPTRSPTDHLSTLRNRGGSQSAGGVRSTTAR